jgi:phosphate transport system protein
MIRKTFEQSLQRLSNDVLVLGSMVETALQQSVLCLQRQDLDGARIVIAEDRLIDEKRFAIESDTLSLIATQQPMAGDMRILAAVLIIVNELERVGDYAKGIGRIAVRIGHEPPITSLINISRMHKICREMLHTSLQAFIHQDIEAVTSIIKLDDEVDSLYEQMYRELLVLIIQDPLIMQQANHLLFVAHNLERAADRATNICERVIYCVTGELMDTGWKGHSSTASSSTPLRLPRGAQAKTTVASGDLQPPG